MPARVLNFVQRTSLEEIVSQLLMNALQQRNYCLPQNNSRVMNLIYKFYETINER